MGVEWTGVCMGGREGGRAHPKFALVCPSSHTQKTRPDVVRSNPPCSRASHSSSPSPVVGPFTSRTVIFFPPCFCKTKTDVCVYVYIWDVVNIFDVYTYMYQHPPTHASSILGSPGRQSDRQTYLAVVHLHLLVVHLRPRQPHGAQRQAPARRATRFEFIVVLCVSIYGFSPTTTIAQLPLKEDKVMTYIQHDALPAEDGGRHLLPHGPRQPVHHHGQLCLVLFALWVVQINPESDGWLLSLVCPIHATETACYLGRRRRHHPHAAASPHAADDGR